MAYPPGDPELGHFEGDAAKVANAWHRGDELAMRLAAQDLAGSIVSLMLPLNRGSPVHSRQATLRSLLASETYRPATATTCSPVSVWQATPPSNAFMPRPGACPVAPWGAPLGPVHLRRDASQHQAELLRDDSLRRYVVQALGD
jgi:hypothetical protein